ncbi:MAG: M23 family metallopeptidase [Bacilli bacterium]|nr:M23 family metallopeptidase [Bacilli bacterium]
MKRKRLRPFVVPTLSFILLFSLFISTFFMKVSSSPTNNLHYVTDIILGNRLPVMNITNKTINYPYTNKNVTIGKTFYDYKASEESQEKSIIKYDDTYMQNSGVDFVCEEVFDVLSVLDGEVISVSEDETVGKVVKIQHDNNYVSVYQGLSEVSVRKGDKVIQNQVLGKSGTNKIDEELGNHLHFELYINNVMQNPTNYLGKSINEIKGE